MNRMRQLVFALTITLCVPAMLPVTGCNLGAEMKDGIESAMKAREQIKSDLGVDCHISYNINNGKRVVKVELASTPKGDAAETKAKVEAIVRAKFKRVDEVDIKL